MPPQPSRSRLGFFFSMSIPFYTSLYFSIPFYTIPSLTVCSGWYKP